ncbi:MAG: hypothetical protein ABJC10_00455 [Acidobacteriota bacterium]
MGAVHEAIDERLETTVALKESLFADERLRKQFEREAKLPASMHHPALPRVSDHFGEGNLQFLVMPIKKILPDGAEVMIFPHGTRMVTKPNGVPHVLCPQTESPAPRRTVIRNIQPIALSVSVTDCGNHK